MEWGEEDGFIARTFTLKKNCLNAKPEVNVNTLTNILLNFKAIMNGECFVYTINQDSGCSVERLYLRMQRTNLKTLKISTKLIHLTRSFLN